MEGFVKNKSSEWAYAMKRSIRPGGEVPLKELYEQYGKKYDMTPGDEFVKWLKEVKLRGSDKWDIVFDFKNINKSTDSGVASSQPTVQVISNSSDSDYTSSVVIKQLQVEDVVNLTVRKAREVIPRVTDLNLLKYSLTEARQLSDKDSLCRLLQKRVRELQISR